MMEKPLGNTAAPGSSITVDMSTVKCRRRQPFCMHRDELLPSDLPIGGLISVLHRHRNILINTRMEGLGISAGTFSPLMYLAHNPDATQDVISMHLSIDKAAIARAFRRLEEEGLVRRIPDEENRRKMRLILTTKGRDTVREMTAIADGIDRDITAGLTDGERGQFLTMLRTIAQATVALK